MPRLNLATILGLLLTALATGPSHACTSFCMETPDGPIYGTNLDLFFPGDGLVFVNRRGIAKMGYFEGAGGEVASWTSTHGSVTFNLAGRELAWGGVNEAGLAMSTMELKASKCPDADERPPVSEGYLVQYVLDTCATVPEAVAAIEGVRPWKTECFSHFMVADAEGNAAAFEYLDKKLVCYTGDALPLKAMANMRYDRAITAWQRGGPRWWWSNPGQSAERVAGAAARMESFDAQRDTCAITHALETLTRVVAAPHTRWNVVFDLADRRLWYRSDRSPQVKSLALAACDFSCDAPLLMLDVNTAPDGNLAAAFTPYDHDVNLELFQVFCARWGIDVSDESAVDLMRLFEGFECAP